MVSTPAFLAAIGSSPAAAKRGRAEEAVVDRFLTAYRAADATAMFAVLADDIYFEDPTFHLLARNKEEMKPIADSLQLFREIGIEPFNRIVATPWVISQQRISGAFRTAEGLERKIDVAGMSMFEVRGGKIVRWYDYYDVLTFREQAGQTAQ
jgi:limonene-1,2-epoxide hydrolase